MDLALNIPSEEIVDYAISIPLASKTRTTQVKEIRKDSYPLSAVWVEAKLVVPLVKDGPEQMFSVQAARPIFPFTVMPIGIAIHRYGRRFLIMTIKMSSWCSRLNHG